MNTDQKNAALSHAEKLTALQLAFPALGITLGYIGNTYGLPGTPAWRDDRAFYVFTTAVSRDTRLPNNWGERINVACDHHEMTVEQIKRKIMLRDWKVPEHTA